jgi:alkylation response protein AidB-like acyl-CoA dehydrogenase
MDVRLSDEQQDLQAMVRRLAQVSVEATSPSEHSLSEKSVQSIWSSLSEAGLLALRLDEKAGGMGATAVEVALVTEQLALGGAYVPFFDQGVLAPALLSAAGADTEAHAIGTGDLRCTVQLSNDLTGWGQPNRAGVAIDASGADYLLTVETQGVVQIHRMEGKHLPVLDLTRRTVASHPRHGSAMGVRPVDDDDLARLAALGLTALAADLVGLSQRALDLTVGYVKERKQFDVPVGSFQAIQHLLADAAMLAESARSCMWHAAWAVDALGSSEALLAARHAKIFCGNAAREIIEIAIQCHGGIGVTWEYPLHVLLRRALTDNQLFGGPDHHVEALASIRSSPPIEWSPSGAGEGRRSIIASGLEFGDSEAERVFRQRLRQWLRKCSFLETLTISGSGVDEAPARTHEWRELLASAGWVGLSFPEQYGGHGLSPVYEAIVNDELGESGAPPAPPINHITNAIRLFGTEQQKRDLLPGLLSCKVRWCQGFSEPNAGSDLAGLTTRGVLTSHDGHFSYRVTGQKIWTSDAIWAHWCLLLLRTEFDVSRHRGLSMLLVPMDTPGIEVRPIVTAYGSEEFAEVFFEDVVIHASQLLGQPGQGWEIAMALLGFERGPSDMGWTARLYHQLTQIEAAIQKGEVRASAAQRGALAEAWVGVEALRIHVQRSTSARLDGSAPGPEGSIDKLLMTKVDQQLNHVIVDILGADAVLDDSLAFPGYIWSRAQSIFGGTQQVQRNIVAQRVLGLPAS